MSQGMDEAFQEFLEESAEMLERVSSTLTDLDQKRDQQSDADRHEAVRSIYRDIHSVKGSAQLFGCRNLGDLAHAMEASLDPVRSGHISLASELVDRLFEGLDQCRSILGYIKANKAEPDVRSVLASLIPRITETTMRLLQADFQNFDQKLIPQDPLAAEALIGQPPVTATQATPEPETTQNTVTTTAAPATPAASAAKQPAKQPAAKKKAQGGATPPGSGDNTTNRGTETVSETIRVQVETLEKLMNLVGELVLVRNQMTQYTSQVDDDGEFLNLAQRLGLVTTELQNEVMKTRMQPIGSVLTKFNRVVRDIARELDKKIELRLTGTESELDRTLIEAIKDPLTHIVRNSTDHGLETPEERIAAGKNPTGIVSINAYHEGGQFIVDVADDGRGLNKSRILDKALERGIVTKERAQSLVDREIYNLIFAPGFSTASAVSSLSGRGVGMDVVRTNIESIGGSVELNSEEGQGTQLKLKIPLTLAIVPALIVRCAGERYAVPQVKLVELVRVEEGDPNHHIEQLQGRPVYRLRGRLLPLLDLAECLKVDAQRVDTGVNIAVLNGDKGHFGIIVDEILDSTDIVVKPLGGVVKDLGVYSGATVMGDGSVALTLDVTGLADREHLFDGQLDDESAHLDDHEQAKDFQERQEYLTVSLGDSTRYAVPLVLVQRLEEFKPEQVEYSGDRRLINYRGEILPLIDVRQALNLPELPHSGDQGDSALAVIVVSRHGRSFGLQVRQILDVIETVGTPETGLGDRPGLIGSTIHDGMVLTVLDGNELVDIFTGPRAEANVGLAAQRSNMRILLAEDNAFFRKFVMDTLTDAGYKVDCCKNGMEAFTQFESQPADYYNIIVSDIEMPQLDGLGFATKVRKLESHAQVPMVALSTRFTERDQQNGRKAGFNAYLAKLDPEELLATVDGLVGLEGDQGGTANHPRRTA